MILIHTADLMFAVRIDSTARGLGFTTAPVRTAERLRERLVEAAAPPSTGSPPGGATASEIRGLIVELDPQSICLDLIREARALRPLLPIVAFGPHVLVDLLRTAGELGASMVMPRGRFTAQLVPILRQLESGAPLPNDLHASQEE